MPSQRYNNKANGPVGIPAEILKFRGAKLHQHIHALIMTIWDQEVIPSDLRDALIVIQALHIRDGSLQTQGSEGELTLGPPTTD